MRLLSLFTLIAIVLGIPGCGFPSKLRDPRRMQFGRVWVLPGIEGGTILSRNVALGLSEGGVRSAITNYDWTYGVPGALAFNLVSFERNLRQARELADDILAYQRRFPDRPVQLVGHSGGAGIIVLALESLPDGAFVDQAILLGVALSPDYNLAPALRRAKNGIINFYSQRDVALLKLGTTAAGTIDRTHGVSAGAVGFSAPPQLPPEERRLYSTKLRQIAWNERMREFGAPGTHIGWARQGFSQRFLAPIVTRVEARYTDPRSPTLAPPPAPDAPPLDDAPPEESRSDDAEGK
ncbi:MAG: DUF726 domain-containing protein [Phycisphaerae bacterium]|nr:DUF726 domain-containing protein [Phycisphaerae bacterium]